MTNEEAAQHLHWIAGVDNISRHGSLTGNEREACRMGAAALRSPGAAEMREAAAQGGEPAHSRWNEDGVDYCGGCGRWMPEGTGRVAFDGTVICKGRTEKPLLREPQPEPAVGDDEALLESSPSRYEDLMAIEQLQTQVDHYRTGMIEARAALVAAEQEKERAVAEEREACRMIAANYALNCVDSAGRCAANTIAECIRARAGRNDGQV